MSRKVFDQPLVLFRSASKTAVALLDRCAHRGAPLSAGSRLDGGVQCPYHGWTYTADGRCRQVPSLCSASKLPRVQLPSFACHEQQGYVWLWPEAQVTPPAKPPRITSLDWPGYNSSRYGMTLPAALFSCLENILDVPHTAYLHGGLFRRAGTRRAVQVAVHRMACSLEAHYGPEPVPAGVLGRVLAPGGGTVHHVDRFTLPNVAQVEYALGTRHVCISNFLTPIDAAHTEMYTVASWRLPGGPLWGALLRPVALWVARQDCAMLAQVQARSGLGGTVSTAADVLGPLMARYLREAAAGERSVYADAAPQPQGGRAPRPTTLYL